MNMTKKRRYQFKLFLILMLSPTLSWAVPEDPVATALHGVLGGDSVVTPIFGREFEGLLTRDGIELDVLTLSLSSCAEMRKSSGKSGSIFIKTSDEKFIIKSISRVEFETFRRIAPEYFGYLLDHPESGIIPIYGMFKYVYMGYCGPVASGTRYLIVMPNLAPRSAEIGQTPVKTRFFDLKGRTPKKNHHPLNDDLVDDNIYPNDFLVGVPGPEAVHDSIKNDVGFLKQEGLMDYSLFMFEKDSIVDSVHIIDYLTPYNYKKHIANFCKRFKWRQEQMSTVSPNRYAARFQEMVDRVLGLDSP